MKKIWIFCLTGSHLLAVKHHTERKLPVETINYSYHRYTKQQIKNYYSEYRKSYFFNRKWQNTWGENPQKISPGIIKILNQYKSKIACPEKRQAISDFIKGKKPFFVSINND